MKWKQESGKKLRSTITIWFLALVILITLLTTFQTIQYIQLKQYNPEKLFELTEANMTGYDEMTKANRTFNFGSYSQIDLFENYQYDFSNVKNNMTLRVEVDNNVVIQTTVHALENYTFTYFKRFTPVNLLLSLFSSKSTLPLEFNLQITQLTNSVNVAKSASEFIYFVIVEIFVLVLLLNWQTEDSWIKNQSSQVGVNLVLLVLILWLLTKN